MVNDIYKRSLAGAQFLPLCGGNQDNDEGESCMEIAQIPGADDLFAVRDGKYPEREALRFTRAELVAAGVRLPV